MKRYVIALLCCGSVLFGAEHVDISQTDFIERVINFVIFVAILWYFVADKLKALLQNRKNSIAKRFEETQNKIKLAKKSKEQAQKQLEEAKKRALDIIATAKKEAVLIEQKYEEQSRIDIDNLIKNSESIMKFEQHKMEIELVEQVLKELLKTDIANLSSDKYVNILNKKVA